jgi:hypothetical protein
LVLVVLVLDDLVRLSLLVEFGPVVVRWWSGGGPVDY